MSERHAGKMSSLISATERQDDRPAAAAVMVIDLTLGMLVTAAGVAGASL